MFSKLSLKSTLIVFLFLFSISSIRTILLPSPSHAFSLWGWVLGDSDEEDKNNEDEKEEDREDEDKEDEEKEREDEKKEQEKEREREEEQEEEQKKEQEKNKSKTRETIVSDDGTRTVIKKETEGNKVESEIKVYNAAGQLIEERKIKTEDGNEVKVEIKTRAGDGSKLSEIKFKQEDDGGLKLEIKDEEGTKSRVRYDDKKAEVRVRSADSDDENEIEDDDLDQNDDTVIRLGDEENEFEIEHGYQKAKVKFPLTVDDDTGKVYVTTGSGELKELTNMPDQIVEKISERNSSVVVKEMEIKEDGEELKYEISADKIEKLFGIVDVAVPMLMEYDPVTGEFKYSTSDFGSSLLDLLSF